jgi:hypothetical protein
VGTCEDLVDHDGTDAKLNEGIDARSRLVADLAVVERLTGIAGRGERGDAMTRANIATEIAAERVGRGGGSCRRGRAGSERDAEQRHVQQHEQGDQQGDQQVAGSNRTNSRIRQSPCTPSR